MQAIIIWIFLPYVDFMEEYNSLNKSCYWLLIEDNVFDRDL